MLELKLKFVSTKNANEPSGKNERGRRGIRACRSKSLIPTVRGPPRNEGLLLAH